MTGEKGKGRVRIGDDGRLTIDWDTDPIPDPPIEDLEHAENDDAANSEARGLQEGNLQEVAAENQHKRDEGLKDELWWMIKWALRVAFLIIVIAALVWCWHLLMPEKWWFLTESQISKIETFGAGGISAALMNVARKNMPGNKQ